MIKQVKKISDFGVFKDFSDSSELNPFDKVNIIYGWNYSGKTTFSRIFSSIEKKELHNDYPSAEFILEKNNGNKIKSIDFNDSPIIRVFNSDFIKNNLEWDSNSCSAILLIGEESIKIENEIKNFNNKKKCIESRKNKVVNELYEASSKIENDKINEARTIKEKLKIPNFDKRNFNTIIDRVKSNYHNCILSIEDEMKEYEDAKLEESDKLNKLDEYCINFKLDNYPEKINEFLGRIPHAPKTIEYLVNNPSVENWIETGLEIHKNKSETCEFCKNIISKERYIELNNHFSEDMKNFKETLRNEINVIRDKKIPESSVSIDGIYKSIKDNFTIAKETLNEEIKKYNKTIDLIIEEIEKKISSPHEIIEREHDIEYNSLESALRNYNRIIQENNTLSENLTERQRQAQEQYKNHIAAKFIRDKDLIAKEKSIEKLNIRIDNFHKIMQDINVKIDALLSQIDNAQIGCDKLNDLIHKFLGNSEIKIVVEKENGNDKFLLLRNDEPAKNLSEGEKTTIAFSFFLTKLLELENFSDTIVYIDDPISSLDSNHLFQVNALMREFFFQSPTSNGSWRLKCDQLFISTHNFDFFSLLRELPKKKKRDDAEKRPEDIEHSYYFIEKFGIGESTLINMPMSLLKYSSEYHFLFKELWDYYSCENRANYSKLLNMPNMMRRFLELYTYSRIPTNIHETVDERTEQLWGSENSKHILKVCHYFSHANSIVRMKKISELYSTLPYAVDELMKLISEDKLHFNQLKKAANINNPCPFEQE